MTQKTERRNYFRINDTIGLAYTVINDNEKSVAGKSGEFETKLDYVLAEIDAKFNQAANTVWQENPTIAQALGLLNEKISILAAHSPQGAGESIAAHKEKAASISGCGMAFHCSKPQVKGTRLRVSVVIKPSNIDVRFTATVIACEPSPENPAGNYWMRIEIDEDSETAKELLIQHVVQKQYSANN